MRKRWIALVMAAVMSVPAGLLAAGTQNKITYDMNNSPINGTYKEPSKSGAKFLGWATTKEKADAGTVDFNATPEDKTNASLNGIGSGQTKTVYAVWQEGNAKYAVALYGIDQDTAKMGGGTYTHTMTFGPATGANYVTVTTSKAAHIAASSETDNDKCIHNHSWNEVIALCKTDPHVFDKCVKKGCTKTVNLDINDTLKGGGWKDSNISKETGDGPSLLVNELHDEFRVWQPGTGSGDFRYGDNTGGYPASRIRAVLNGYDWTSDSSHGNTTDLTRANQKYVYTRSDESSNTTGWNWRTADLTDISTVTSDNCLLSCFPENLQAAIVPKAVKSDTVYNDVSGNNVTTWDKLWLFSGNEMYSDFTNRKNEGTPYDRITKQGITTSAYAGNKGYYFYSGSTAYGDTDYWWLRSAFRYYRDNACFVDSSGDWNRNSTGFSHGAVAPGFVLGK